MEEALLLGLLGLGTGTFGTMVGTGGGVILVPLLLLFSDLEPEVVAGTSLALVAVNSFSGSYLFRRMGLVDKRSGWLFAAAAVPGSIIAPFAVAEVGGEAFRIMFGLLLVSLATHMIVRSLRGLGYESRSKEPRIHTFSTARHVTTRKGETFDYQFNEALAGVFNFFVGFISAFFGTGGGFLRTPVLVAAFGFPVRIAVATSVFALSIYATAGSVVHAGLGHLDFYPTFVFAGLGLLFGSQIGAQLASRIASKWIVRALIVLLFGMGARVLVQGIFG